METYYKVLNKDGWCVNGGTGSWPLPKGKRKGKRVKVEGKLIPCQHGLHVCTLEQLPYWCRGYIFEVEVDLTDSVVSRDKTVVHRARLIHRIDTWNERTMRLFACDCADRALRIRRKAGKTVEPRSTNAIKVARRFANGKATQQELRAAADAAAAYAADVAYAYAADAAAAAAYAAAADAAAYAAAYAADAADAAADAAAARIRERNWQAKRLGEYLSGVRL